MKILSGTAQSTSGEDSDETDKVMKTIWCIEEEVDSDGENKIDWGNRTAFKHLTTVLKVQ